MDLRAVFDLLVRVDAHSRVHHGLIAERDAIADRDVLVHTCVRAHVAPASQHGPFDDSAAADVGTGVDHAVRDPAALTQRRSLPEHGVRPDRRVGRDRAVVADECRSLDAFDVGDLHAFAEPDLAGELQPADVESNGLVEGVEVRLPVLVEVADVLPVAVADAAVDRQAELEQQREQLLREVERSIGRHVLEHLGLEHVDAGVDRVREDLPPRRLLEEALDAAVLPRDDDPELERVLDRLQPDRAGGALLAVKLDDLPEVDVRERIPRDDEERVVEPRGRVANRAGRAERARLDGVLELEPEARPVAEVGADRLGQEGDRDDHVLEPVHLEQLEDVLHARLADDRHHRLGLDRGERPEPCPLAARHHDGLHEKRTSRRAFNTYSPSETNARARPIQKIQSGQSVPLWVTMIRPSEANRSHVAAFPTRFT